MRKGSATGRACAPSDLHLLFAPTFRQLSQLGVQHFTIPLLTSHPTVDMHSTAEEMSSLRAQRASNMRNATAHARLVILQWETTKKPNCAVVVDGESLNLAKAALVGKRRAAAALSNDCAVKKKIDQSVEVLRAQLDRGSTIYGMSPVTHHCQ